MKQGEGEMEKKKVQQKEMRFTFETSFYDLIFTSGHIFLNYGVGTPFHITAVRPRPRAAFNILLNRPAALSCWVFNTIAAHRWKTSRFEKKNISMTKIISLDRMQFWLI